VFLQGLVLLLVAPAGYAAENDAKKNFQFDFGSELMVEQGYLPVTSHTNCTPERTYGWVDSPELLIRDEGKPDNLRRDFVMGSSPATFRISGIQPGQYLLTIVCGDMATARTTRVKISGNDVELPALSQGEGEVSILRTTVAAGESLDITFDSPRGNWIVNGLTLAQAESSQPPVVGRSRMALSSDGMKSHTLRFRTDSPGKKLRLNHWGLDTALPDPNNVRRGLIYMGPDQVDVIRVSFPINQPLIDDDLPASKREHFTTRVAIAKLAGDKPLTMLPDTEAGVHPWYKNGKEIIPERWVQLLEVAQRHYGKQMQTVEAFNEADWGWGQGSAQNLNDILEALKKSKDFAGAELSGPSTLSSDAAEPWYRAIKGNLQHGSTHALGGSFHGYVNFFLNVGANGHLVSQPELHNLVEGIAGAEYGLQSAIWWLTAEHARSEFVKAVQGEQLAYAEDRPNWSAAAVYRAPGGKVQAFLGSSERMGKTTSYRFVSRDRDVFFNGDGPRRDFTMSIRRDTDDMIDITWGPDVPPPVRGRYIVANRMTGKVLTVADESRSIGARLQLMDYSQESSQQWEVVPIFTRWQDQAYVTLRAVHSGKVAGIPNESYDEGARITQSGEGESVSQHWFLDYAGDNCFYIRNRWSAQCLEFSAGNDASIQQATLQDGKLDQQWRLIPVGVSAIDLNSPEAPRGVVASSKPMAVELKWEANREPDIAGYTILRSGNPGGPYDTIARGVKETSYIDRDARQQGPYFYRVKAVDQSLNSSVVSSEVSASPVGGRVLVASYSMDNNVTDASGNGNHAAAYGKPEFGVGMNGAKSLMLDGDDDYLRLPPGVVDSDEITIAAWIYLEGNIEWQRVFDFGNDETKYVFLTTCSNNGKLRLAAMNGGEELRLDARMPPDSTWSHVAVTIGGGAAKIYLNGKLVASSDHWTVKPADFKPIFNFVGKSQFVSDPTFRGRMADLQIHNSILPPERIAELAGNRHE
jgi:fibronectin type 3 domain-containing protein